MMSNRFRFYVLFLLLSLNMTVVANTASAENILSETKKISLYVGDTHVIEMPSPHRVIVGNGKLLKIEILEHKAPELGLKHMVIIGEEAGSTELSIWHKNGGQSHYKVHITKDDPEIHVRKEKTILMRVKIVEFRKSALKKIGIDWGNAMDGPAFAAAGDLVTTPLFRAGNTGIFSGLPRDVDGFHSFFGMSTTLNSTINLLANNGEATTLAEPRLSCKNGGAAQFLAGGEIPYPVINANGASSVEFKQYGIKLDISPSVSEDGVIDAGILTEVSQIDPAVNINGAPGFLTRRTKTHVNVKDGETIVISGLLSSEVSKDLDKVPGLGNVPILGKLFQSENFRDNLTELVIFVTPEVIEPNSDARDQKILKNIDNRLKKHKDAIRYGVVL